MKSSPPNKNLISLRSKPFVVSKTKLSKTFTMQVRKNPEKPGRSIKDVWDIRKPLLKDFENNYSYIVTLRGKGNIAGNHYHKNKQELIFPIMGNFTVLLENIESKEREVISLEVTKHQVIYFPSGIAHAIRAETDRAIFLVIATSAEGDVVQYKIL